MQKLMIMSVFCLGLLSGCETSTVPKFEHMTLEELAEYNKSRNLAQMIVCSDENRSFSRVRRRRCMTVEAMYGSDVQLSQLQLLNNIPGLGTGE